LRDAGEPPAAASGVLVDATGTVGAAARMARLVEGFNRLRRPDDIVRAMLTQGVAMVGGSTATVHVLSGARAELVVAGSAGVPADVVEERFGRVPLSSPLPVAEV